MIVNEFFPEHLFRGKVVFITGGGSGSNLRGSGLMGKMLSEALSQG